MIGYEGEIHSFIIKIWLEETAEEAGRASWRGHITHVPSGERRYIEDFEAIKRFMIPYLESMGVALD
jgi:hypothetical protein